MESDPCTKERLLPKAGLLSDVGEADRFKGLPFLDWAENIFEPWEQNGTKWSHLHHPTLQVTPNALLLEVTYSHYGYFQQKELHRGMSGPIFYTLVHV
jgi:hypothetical protein